MEGSSKLMDHGKVRSSSPPTESETLADFEAAVRPFHRLVYLVAFACTKSVSVAERIAFNAMAHAFKEWSRRPKDIDDFKMYLIRTVIFEARAHVEVDSALYSVREDIDDLLAQQGISEWRPIPLDAIRNNTIRSNLTAALQELSAPTAVTLLLRDAVHLTTLQIADVIGESHQRVQARLAYGRIAVCVKLARCASGRGIQDNASLAAAY